MKLILKRNKMKYTKKDLKEGKCLLIWNKNRSEEFNQIMRECFPGDALQNITGYNKYYGKNRIARQIW